MSATCPSCRMESAEGAVYCDFCKEPFAKKPRARPAAAEPPAAPDPLAGIPKEKLLEMPADQLLKSDLPPAPALPTWVRPVAYAFLAVTLASGVGALYLLQQRYQERQQDAPPPAGRIGTP